MAKLISFQFSASDFCRIWLYWEHSQSLTTTLSLSLLVQVIESSCHKNSSVHISFSVEIFSWAHFSVLSWDIFPVQAMNTLLVARTQLLQTGHLNGRPPSSISPSTQAPQIQTCWHGSRSWSLASSWHMTHWAQSGTSNSLILYSAISLASISLLHLL